MLLASGLLAAMMVGGLPAQQPQPEDPGAAAPGDDKSDAGGATLSDDYALESAKADPSFERFFSAAQYAKASAELETAVLTDVVLQLLEGERILRRPHKAIDSKGLALKAVHLAARNRDAASLARLASVGVKEVSETAVLLLPLAKQARAASGPLTLDAPTKQETQIAQIVTDDLQRARLVGSLKDAAGITAFVKTALAEESLSGKNAKLLLSRIEAESKTLPEEDEQFRKLMAPSRDWGDGTQAGPKWATDRTSYKVGNQKLMLFAGTIDAIRFDDIAGLNAKANAMINYHAGKRTHVWQDTYYSFKLPQTESVYAMVAAYNQSTGKSRWVAMKFQERGWIVRDSNNTNVQNLPDNTNFDYNWSSALANGQSLIIRIKNPPNNANFAKTHVLYKFATY